MASFPTRHKLVSPISIKLETRVGERQVKPDSGIYFVNKMSKKKEEKTYVYSLFALNTRIYAQPVIDSSLALLSNKNIKKAPARPVTDCYM